MGMTRPMDPTTEAADDVAGEGRRHRALTLVMLALIATGLIVATVGNVFRVQDVDPQYTRIIIERTSEFGGTFYENGIINKGPLESLLHSLGASVTSHDTYWYAIAGFSALLALVLAFAASRTASFAGATAPIAAAVGVATFFHFTFSGARYAGVLYSRNITVALLAAWWLINLEDRAWSTPRRRLLATSAAALIAGLAVQTLFTTVFAGAVLAGMTILMLRLRAGSGEPLRLSGVAVIVADLSFLSAMA